MHMDVLKQRRAETEARFNAAKVKKEQFEAQAEEANNECLRLQGEHRAVTELINQAKTVMLPDVGVADEKWPGPSEGAPTDSLEEQRKAAKEAKHESK
jgi:hypothetical protein